MATVAQLEAALVEVRPLGSRNGLAVDTLDRPQIKTETGSAVQHLVEPCTRPGNGDDIDGKGGDRQHLQDTMRMETGNRLLQHGVPHVHSHSDWMDFRRERSGFCSHAGDYLRAAVRRQRQFQSLGSPVSMCTDSVWQ